jgi:hypothetical protein
MVQAAATTSTIAAAAPLLNVYKKVPVIRVPSDSLTYEDAEGNQKSVSVQELGDAISTAVRFWIIFFVLLPSSYASEICDCTEVVLMLPI